VKKAKEVPMGGNFNSEKAQLLASFEQVIEFHKKS